MNDLDVVWWPVDRPRDYPKNARKWSAQAIEKVGASLRAYGFRQPVVVDRDEVICIGHLRRAAARSIGMSQVPVHVARDLTPAQIRGLRLMDNRSHEEADWDLDLLGPELDELRGLDFDLDLTGFEPHEIDDFLSNPGDDDRANAVPPLSENPASRIGDLWICGPHRLLCGDATSMDAVENVLDGGLADMVFCDPPYSVSYTGKTSRKLTIKNDDLGAGFVDFLRDACANMIAVCKGAIYICMSSSELHTLYQAFTEAGGHWSTFVIWAKNHFTLGRSDYQRMYEPILYGWREGTQHFWCGDRDQGDVWFINRPVANREHPTQKPVELVERALRNSSKTRDTILDVFGGSGTTMIACEKAGRQARLIELDPQYVDTAVRRWQAFTGKAVLFAPDGRTFDDVKAERLGVAA